MKENGFLLIEEFGKLFNTKNYSHQGLILGGLLLHCRVSSKPAFQPILNAQNNAVG